MTCRGDIHYVDGLGIPGSGTGTAISTEIILGRNSRDSNEGIDATLAQQFVNTSVLRSVGLKGNLAFQDFPVNE